MKKRVVRLSLVTIMFMGIINLSVSSDMQGITSKVTESSTDDILANCNMHQEYSDPGLDKYMMGLMFKDDETQIINTANIQTYTVGGYSIKPYTENNAASDYVSGLPKIGKWMMVTQTGFSHPIPAAWVYWLGSGSQAVGASGYMQPAEHVLEAVNFLFLVKARNENTANTLLINSLDHAGFSDAQSQYHTGGYGAYFNDKYINQVAGYPECSKQLGSCDLNYRQLTFAKGSYTTAGYHFRALGPYKVNDQYYIYSASLSQESPYLSSLRCGHMFVSFIRARDELASGFIKQNIPVYSVRLDNTLPMFKGSILRDQVFYTGDFQQGGSSNLTFIAVIN